MSIFGKGNSLEDGRYGVSAVEQLGKDNFEYFLNSINAFEGDAQLVHGHVNKMAPWEKPARGSYNLTVMPTGLTMLQLAEKLKNTTIIVEGCMDKDASSPIYEYVRRKQGDKIFFLGRAGGPVQMEGERKDAHRFSANYLTKIREMGGMPNLRGYYGFAHNSICQAVAEFLKILQSQDQRLPLTEVLDQRFGDRLEGMMQLAETLVMGALAVDGTQEFALLADKCGLNRILEIGVADIDRRGRFDIHTVSRSDLGMTVEDLADIDGWGANRVYSLVAQLMR